MVLHLAAPFTLTCCLFLLVAFCRKPDQESGSLSGCTVYCDAAPVFLYDLMDYEKPKPRTLSHILSGKKGIKDPGQHLPRDPHPGVNNLYINRTSFIIFDRTILAFLHEHRIHKVNNFFPEDFPCTYENVPLLRDSLDRVFNKVQECLLESLFVREDGYILRDVLHDADLGRNLALDKADGLFNELL